MKFILFLLFIFLNVGLSVAQDSTQTVTIITDRPDASNTPFLVPKGQLQVEMGIQVDGNKDESIGIKDYQTLYTLNNTSIKYSPLNFLELKFISGYGIYDLNRKSYFKGNWERDKNVLPIILGSKIFICKQKGILPHTTFESNFTLPIYGTLNSPIFVSPELRLLMFNQLNERLSLSYNIGLDYQNSYIRENPRYLYTLSLGISINEKLSGFIENYGYYQTFYKPDYRIDGGFTYLLKNNLQIDIAGGYGLSDLSTDFFVTTGLSWRVKLY